MDLETVEDKEEVVNNEYAFAVGITIAAVSRDKIIPVSVGGVEINMFIDLGARLMPFLCGVEANEERK